MLYSSEQAFVFITVYVGTRKSFLTAGIYLRLPLIVRELIVYLRNTVQVLTSQYL